MSLPKPFSSLSGEWKGSKHLYLNGESGPVKTSNARMTIAKAARESFLLLVYSWKYETDPHEGLLMLGYDDKQQSATAAWGDSWHMRKSILHCAGKIDATGACNVLGHYQAPPGPDWGWRIVLATRDQDAIELVMHNISPEGQEDLAVRMALARVG